MFDQLDIDYMNLAIDLAKKGHGSVHPNPMVGCVITKGEKVVSTGYHKIFGGDHAEKEALRGLPDDIDGLTMYVSLEPCLHKGKTGPCCDLIDPDIFNRVVISDYDPNPLASGGYKRLKESSIKVEIGLLKEESRKMNKVFYTYFEKCRPFVILKSASTLDGFIAENDGSSKWISNETSRSLNHKTRSECDAILVGSKTVLSDNPSLDSHGKGTDPLIVVIDPDNKIDDKMNIYSKKKPIIFSKPGMVKDPLKNISYILKELYKKNIQSVVVEGGAKTISKFLDSDLFDEIHTYIAPKLIGSGINIYQGKKSITKNFELEVLEVKQTHNDIRIIYGRIE